MISLTKKLIAGLAVILIIAFGYLYSVDFRPLLLRVVETKVDQMINTSVQDDNEFKILFCGTGTPTRTVERGQPCLALVANGKLFLFDAGEGSLGKLLEYEAPIGKLEAIFITHHHSDHISGIAEVLHNTSLFARNYGVEVFGPPGTEQMLEGFDLAYGHDLEERQRVLGKEDLNITDIFSGGVDFDIEGDELKIIYDNDGLKISSFLVVHPQWDHAYGYKIEHKGKVVIVSGDTAPSDGIRRYSKNADMLIHEALNAEVFSYIGDLMEKKGGLMSKDRFPKIAAAHTSTLDLAEIAKEAEVKHLYLTHLIPTFPDIWIADKLFASGMDDIFKGEITIARDGQWVDVDKL